MSNFNNDIGRTIKEYRLARGYSQKDVCDKLQLNGYEITPAMLSLIESGKRRIYADTLGALCQVLNCSPMSLYPLKFENKGDKSRLLEEVLALPQDEVDVINYGLKYWDGNTRALLLYCGLYMSLPARFRQDVAGLGVFLYRKALEDHQIDNTAPAIDLDYLEAESARLWQWKQNEF